MHDRIIRKKIDKNIYSINKLLEMCIDFTIINEYCWRFYRGYV